MAKDFDPKLKINYVPNLAATGAKEGFTAVTKEGDKSVANYNNYGRFILTSFGPIVSLMPMGPDSPRAVPYEEYISNPQGFPNTKKTKYGIIIRINLKDFDTGREIVHFLGTNAQDTSKGNWLTDRIVEQITYLGLTPDTIKDHVFEFGKEKGRSPLGKWYFKHLGTTKEVSKGTPSVNSDARQGTVLANQSPAPAAPVIQNFVLTPDESELIEMLDQMAKSGKIKTTTAERVSITLETGYGQKKTTKARASYIAQHANDYFKELKVEG